MSYADITPEQAANEQRAQWIRADFLPKKPVINQKFLNEAREIEAQWAKTGLLDGIKEKFTRQMTACLLESQRLMGPMVSSWNVSRYLPAVISSEVSEIGTEVKVSASEVVSLAALSTETDKPSL